MPFLNTSLFTCDRNHGVTAETSGDILQSNPPQNWARIIRERTVGVGQQRATFHLCPACVDAFAEFMATVPPP